MSSSCRRRGEFLRSGRTASKSSSGRGNGAAGIFSGFGGKGTDLGEDLISFWGEGESFSGEFHPKRCRFGKTWI